MRFLIRTCLSTYGVVLWIMPWVRTSTTMCFVGQYSNQTSPFSTHFRRKWCCTSMCFVRAWWVGFLINDIAPWLLHQITITFFSSMYPKSIINFVIHMTSFVACVFTMYSTSVVDNAIIGCHFTTPRNGSTFDHENKPCGGPPFFKITTPIRITISKHFLGWCYTKIVISFATYFANIERFVWPPSLPLGRPMLVLSRPYINLGRPMLVLSMFK